MKNMKILKKELSAAYMYIVKDRKVGYSLVGALRPNVS